MPVDPIRAADVFLIAAELPAEQRPDYLASACGGDADLRAEVERLLAAHADPHSLLEPQVAATRGYAPAGPATAAFGGTTDHTPPPEGGAVVGGRYALLERIGEGGMGEVWVARQTEPVKRKVALKLIKPGMDSRTVLARFEAERQALALMDHPNIARVLDGGVTPTGRPFFVMDLVNGLPLTRYCDEARLTPRQRLELFVPVCRAIQHAHQKGVVHRDLKPANILVTLIDGRPIPKVIDFGVAKATAGKLTDESLSTQFGAVVGTLEYMAPEQAGYSGDDIDTRADIYSLGVILYELLTGLRPIHAGRLKAAALTEMIRIIREEEPSKPSTRLSTDASLPTLAALRQTEPRKLMALLRGDLDWVVMKCLEKGRDRRYETASGLAADVERWLTDEPVLARPPSGVYRAGKFVRRNRIGVAAALVVGLALLAGTAGTTAGMVSASRERDRKDEALVRLEREQGKTRAALEDLETETGRTKAALTEAERAGEEAMSALATLTDEVIGRQFAAKPRLTDRDKAFLRSVLAHYERFAAVKGDGAESRAVRGEGQVRAATIHARLGERDAALAARRRAVDTWGRLVGEFPGRPQYRRQWATQLDGLATLVADDGAYDEAEGLFRQAIAEQGRVALERPDDRAAKEHLATHHHNLGLLLARTGRTGAAVGEVRQSTALMKELADAAPSDPGYQEALGHNRFTLGTLLDESGDPTGAAVELRAALAVRRQLAADSPDEPDHRDGLASTHKSLGMVLERLGDNPQSIAEYRRSLEVRKQLAADFPVVPSYRQKLAGSHNALGVALIARRRWDDAEAELRQAITLQRQLAADFLAVPGYAVELGGSCCNFGILLTRRDRAEEAIVWFDQAIQTLTPVAVRDPRAAAATRFLKNTHESRADALMRLNRFTEAVPDWDRAIALADGGQRPRLRVTRAYCLAKTDPDRAIKEVEAVTGAETPADTRFQAARVCSVASSVSMADRTREKAAGMAIALLSQLRDAGYFRDPSRANQLRNDPALDPLRDRDDFREIATSAARPSGAPCGES